MGVGATRGAIPHVVVNRKRIKAPLNGDFFKVLETLVRARADDGRVRKRFERLKTTLQTEFPVRGKWPIPMETAFSLLYVSKDFPEIYGKSSGRRRRPGGRTEIEDFLRLTFNVLDTVASGATHDNLYSRLVSKLEPGDTIITLNYDTALDHALVRAGWNPESGYGLGGGAQKFRWLMQKPAASPKLAGVKLLKLHGSLNWLVTGSYKDIHRVFDAKPSKVMIASIPSRNERRGLIRQIIPPIYGKFFHHLHWQRLWDNAYRALIDADLFVVIGCSLVDSDFHLTGMLGRAITERKRQQNGYVASIAVDRVRIRRKWERLLKGCVSKEIGYRTFAQFANVLLNERQR